jgi:hypothetical protein
MPDKKTLEDVIEAHRAKSGAESLRLTLGPGATPESVDKALIEFDRAMCIYNSFTELERMEAKAHRLRDLLRQVCAKTKRPITGWSQDEYEQRLRDIFALTDLVADIDLDLDIAWMQEQRRKYGKALA